MGSGVRNGNLATQVSALELVTASGDVLKLARDKDGEMFRGAVVGLGALGVITKLTLDTQPAFSMKQYVYENLPLDQLTHHFDEIESSTYSVSLFTDWQKRRVNEVWLKTRIDAEPKFDVKPELVGAIATRNLHSIAEGNIFEYSSAGFSQSVFGGCDSEHCALRRVFGRSCQVGGKLTGRGRDDGRNRNGKMTDPESTPDDPRVLGSTSCHC
jgi:hypothetical protein